MRSLMPENSKKMTTLRQIARPKVVVLAYDGLCTFEFGVAVEIFGLPRPELGDDWYRFAVASVDDVRDMGHGVNLIRKGVSGKTQNQRIEFNMSINNPALTGQVLVNVARASMRQQPGCYTMIEIPVIDLLPGERADIVEHLV